MRHHLIAAALSLAALGHAPMALAQRAPDGPPPACTRHGQPGDKAGKCRKPAPQDARQPHRDAPHPDDRRDTPRIGHSGRDARAVEAPAGMQAAPRGQEYRILDGHVVLVDKNTQRIVALPGPAQAQARR